MPVFKSAWPDGTVSFVFAKNKKEALLELDEFGDPDEDQTIERVDHFHVCLKPVAIASEDISPGVGFELDQVGEGTADDIFGSLPGFQDDYSRIMDEHENGELSDEQVRNMLEDVIKGLNKV